MARGETTGGRAVLNARISLCTSRGKLATQMGPRNQTAPQPGKPFFDYGCQYFTSSDDWFAEEAERWASLGACQPLPAGAIGTLSRDAGFAPCAVGKCWVGNGGMGPMLDRLIEHTAREFDDVLELVSGFPNVNAKVESLEKRAAGWVLRTKGRSELGPFDFVIGGFAQHVLTDPFLKSGGAASERMLRCLQRVESNQLIPIQVSFEGDALPMDFIAAHVYGEESLSWICNNSAKPQHNGRWGTPGQQHLTLLSTAAFAEREFNCNPKGYKGTAEKSMLSAMARVLGVESLATHRPRINRINHWEDGLACNTPPASRKCLLDVDVGLGWCGDFCVSPGLQGAALSGRAMAEVLAESICVGAAFDRAGLLPADEAWPRIGAGETGDTLLDMGAFSPALGLRAHLTHTDLVPSAVGGYDVAAHTGAAGKPAGGGDSGHGKGKGKGKGAGKGKRAPGRGYSGGRHGA